MPDDAIDRIEVSLAVGSHGPAPGSELAFAWVLWLSGSGLALLFGLSLLCTGHEVAGVLLAACGGVGPVIAGAWLSAGPPGSDRIELTRHHLIWRGQKVPLDEVEDAVLYRDHPYLWVQLKQGGVLTVPADRRLERADAEWLHTGLRLRLADLARAETRQEDQRALASLRDGNNAARDERR